MQAFLQSTVIYFPFIMAVVFGLFYAINGYMYQHISVGAYMAWSGIFSFIISMAVALYYGNLKTSVLFAAKPHVILLIAVLSVANFIIWFMSIYAMKYVSPTFVAVGEIGYVIFTPLFGYLLFGRKEVDTYTLIAGVFILIGCAVLIYGKHVNQVAQVTGAS